MLKVSFICINLNLFTGYIIFAIFSITCLCGCAALTKTVPGSNETAKLFNNSYNETWNAILSALETIPLETVEKDKGFIKTGWINIISNKETSGMFFAKRWLERSRLLIYITSISAFDTTTEIAIIEIAEEKPPGGPQAHKWHRKIPDGRFVNQLYEKTKFFLGSSDN